MSLPCGAVGGCSTAAVAQWCRRPTGDELAQIVTVEQQRRNGLLATADPNNPPDFGPLPTAGDTTVPVYGCGAHAISMDAAARIHQAACTAPNAAVLPGCDCTPEPLPVPDPNQPNVVTAALPDHWQPAQP